MSAFFFGFVVGVCSISLYKFSFGMNLKSKRFARAVFVAIVACSGSRLFTRICYNFMQIPGQGTTACPFPRREVEAFHMTED